MFVFFLEPDFLDFLGYTAHLSLSEIRVVLEDPKSNHRMSLFGSHRWDAMDGHGCFLIKRTTSIDVGRLWKPGFGIFLQKKQFS